MMWELSVCNACLAGTDRASRQILGGCTGDWPWQLREGPRWREHSVHVGRIVRKNGQARHGGPCVHGQHVLPHRLTRTGPGKVARALSWDHVLDAEEIQSVATKIKNLQKDS